MMSSANAVRDPVRYKTVLCKNWTAKGKCPYGPRCQFAHGSKDLRDRNAASAAPVVQAPQLAVERTPRLDELAPPYWACTPSAPVAEQMPVLLPAPSQWACADADDVLEPAQPSHSSAADAASDAAAEPTLSPIRALSRSLSARLSLRERTGSLLGRDRNDSMMSLGLSSSGQVVCGAGASEMTMTVRRTISLCLGDDNIAEESEELPPPLARKWSAGGWANPFGFAWMSAGQLASA